MSDEIKVTHTPIQKAITNVETTSNQLHVNRISTQLANNTLGMARKLEEMNDLLEDLISKYQALLLEHGETTMKAVNLFIESEQATASSMNLIK
ncbi:DUF5344 family protein [Virgibacillus chiguensis]|uniref:Uncharacterized protein n=1 Tax=Virgibacillus chiguensis TaxID=411959 RepID=A0A1M5USH9_9BACI|nr:DUF5344 family protein [Virgibacillus chiguensis]SHH65949.1 hypothetical protein SAMN05421807_110115 [Virgibacillus chiguensis]